MITCVLWLNDFQNSGGQAGRKQEVFRTWLSENNIGIGDTLSVLGVLEYYHDKTQVNIHKLRLIRDSSEEMLQYQQTIMAQKVFFDPTKPFERRLLRGEHVGSPTVQQPDYMKAAQIQEQIPDDVQARDVIQHSTKRIKKKIIDFILLNYKQLFFADQKAVEADESKERYSVA